MREMKDSGVEWIGEIPEDWNVGKTLYALSMPITDGPHETPELFDEGIPFISAEAVSCGNHAFGNKKLPAVVPDKVGVLSRRDFPWDGKHESPGKLGVPLFFLRFG